MQTTKNEFDAPYKGKLSGAYFMPCEDLKQEDPVTDIYYEDKSFATNFGDEIVEEHYIGAIKNELFSSHDDVVSFGQELLGWSHTKVLTYLSDRMDRRIDQKLSLLIHYWKDKIKRPTVAILLSHLAKFEKKGIAVRCLMKCKKERSHEAT